MKRERDSRGLERPGEGAGEAWRGLERELAWSHPREVDVDNTLACFRLAAGWYGHDSCDQLIDYGLFACFTLSLWNLVQSSGNTYLDNFLAMEEELLFSLY